MTLGRMPLTVLGLADHRDSGPAGVRRAARGLHPVAARSHCRNELLHSRRLGGHRSRRSPGTRAARRCCGSTCSGSLAIRRSTSRFLPGMGVASHVLSTFSRKPVFGYRAMVGGDVRHRLPGLLRLGPPHVHQRDEPVFGVCVLDPDHDHRRALGHQDVQLAGNDVGREDPVH